MYPWQCMHICVMLNKNCTRNAVPLSHISFICEAKAFLFKVRRHYAAWCRLRCHLPEPFCMYYDVESQSHGIVMWLWPISMAARSVCLKIEENVAILICWFHKPRISSKFSSRGMLIVSPCEEVCIWWVEFVSLWKVFRFCYVTHQSIHLSNSPSMKSYLMDCTSSVIYHYYLSFVVIIAQHAKLN